MSQPLPEYRPTPPVNSLPATVIALALIIMAIEAVFTLGARGMIGGPGAVGWRLMFIQTYGFNSRLFQWMFETGNFPAEHVQRVITYTFIHGSFMHALLAVVMLLALGKFVAEAMGQRQMLVLFFVSSIVGAITFGTFAGAEHQWLIGAYPGVYGLIGGFTCIIWLQLGANNAPRMAAFRMIGFLMMFQLIFNIFFGGGLEWIADIGAFGIGFLLSFILVPGGWSNLLRRLRNEERS